MGGPAIEKQPTLTLGSLTSVGRIFVNVVKTIMAMNICDHVNVCLDPVMLNGVVKYNVFGILLNDESVRRWP